ncbi:hypothetical protein, partial [Staphylococcus haemolyticus]|uniref:hypothetical protein n=1 Tax=Staphylococcus haemolyticus TaxID=1283 RepID=UPI000BC6911F
MDGSTQKKVTLGSVQFGKPLKYNEQNYTNISVTFKSPVDLSLNELENVELQITGHMTDDTINAFKKSNNTQ